MRRLSTIATPVLMFFLWLPLSTQISKQVFGQASGQEKPNASTSAGVSGQARVIGEVTEIDRAALRLSVKLDGGSVMVVQLDPETSYLRVSPEESSLEKA